LGAWIAPLSSQIFALWGRLLKKSLISLMVIINSYIDGRVGSFGTKDFCKEAFSFGRFFLLTMLIFLFVPTKKTLDISTELIGHHLELICME